MLVRLMALASVIYAKVMDEAIAEHGKGLTWKDYEVKTDDGYILTISRLLPAGDDLRKGQPVFLMHGMGVNGAKWLNRINLEIDSLPVRLVNEGYDVWLGNNRGNRMADRHQWLDLSDESDLAQYWDFSFPELAQYDLPAMLSKVYDEAGEQ